MTAFLVKLHATGKVATLVLLGRWTWYLPRWLEWLPHIEVETA